VKSSGVVSSPKVAPARGRPRWAAPEELGVPVRPGAREWQERRGDAANQNLLSYRYTTG
jgi:hypothetical protein